MQRVKGLLGLAVVLGVGVGCQERIATYEERGQLYDRQQICKQLTEILRQYEGPDDYKHKPISRRTLAKYYKDYKIYGCEK